MDGVSTSANSRPALNGAASGMSALKIAAQAEKAVVQVVEQAADMAKAAPPSGQGRYIDKSA